MQFLKKIFPLVKFENEMWSFNYPGQVNSDIGRVLEELQSLGFRVQQSLNLFSIWRPDCPDRLTVTATQDHRTEWPQIRIYGSLPFVEGKKFRAFLKSFGNLRRYK